MEARYLGYSMKNIPIPPTQPYLKSMIKKVENFTTRLRWKAQFFDKKEHSVNNTNFGFKSNFTPPNMNYYHRSKPIRHDSINQFQTS